MKKIIILSGMLCLVISAAASAQISVSFGIPQPTYYEAPVAPAYVAPAYVQYGGYGHVRHDWHHDDRRGHRR